MKNNIFSEVYTIIVLSQLKNPKEGAKIKNPIFYYSAFFTKGPPTTTIPEIGQSLDHVYFKNLMLFNITEDMEEQCKITDGFENRDVNSRMTLYDVHPNIFFSIKFIIKLIDYLQKNPGSNVVLFYKNFSLKMIKTAFKTLGVQISGGNNTLKHILSPQQFLLSKIISILYGNNIDLVTKSFLDISNNKTFTRAIHDFTSEKDRLLLQQIKIKDDASMDPVEYQKILEYKKSLDSSVETSKNIKFNYIQKRDFHSSSRSQSHIQDYTKTDYFPYLSKLTYILDDSNKTDIEKQITLENFLNEFIQKQIENDL